MCIYANIPQGEVTSLFSKLYGKNGAGARSTLDLALPCGSGRGWGLLGVSIRKQLRPPVLLIILANMLNKNDF